ncbi:DUF1996 domain-containing protein [Streptomyces sp. NPDC002073]
MRPQPQRHKRGRLTNKTLALAAVLVLGCAGTAIVAANASGASLAPGAERSAGEPSGSDRSDPEQSGSGARDSAAAAAWTGTVDCPDVGDRLREVPAPARAEVDRLLARMDAQVADAYQQLAQRRADGRVVLDGLEGQRAEAVDGVADAIGRTGAERPEGLDALSGCRITPGPQPQSPVTADGRSRPSGNGPARADFVDITRVRPNVNKPARQRNSSNGSFRSRCGTNREGRFNSDNVIVAPGVSNGAHHMHDYVGNRANDAFATNDSLAAAGTTCTNGDQSTYYWPVLRLQDGRQERDAGAPGGGTEGNAGTILTPKEVSITFGGSPVGKVTAMPRFLRIITGDAKAFTNGTANANASWSCTGFENRQLRDRYPLCPRGSDVVRTFSFQSCWNGRDTDSANHRTHVAFAQADGRCPRGFRAIPQLVQRIVYAVPGGGRSALFAVDSFPEQLHKPVTDHGDFINVMRDGLMNRAVTCINSGRACR